MNSNMSDTDMRELAKMTGLPADPRDCAEAIRKLKALGITPEWIFKGMQKIDEYERKLARERAKK